MSKLPITAATLKGGGLIRLDLPDRPLTLRLYADGGSLLSVDLTRLEADQVRASLADLLSRR